MTDKPFGGRALREDLGDSFPADLVDAEGPALIGESRAATAALVAARLLEHVARAGGTRVKLSAIEHVIHGFERVLTPEARAHCADEALRIVAWTESKAPEPEVPPGDRGVMQTADIESRAAVIRWAIEGGYDVEVEFYDPAEDRWPRMRATPLRLDDTDEPALVLATLTGEITVAIADLRWLMPVERSQSGSPRMAKVIEFPGFAEEE